MITRPAADDIPELKDIWKEVFLDIDAYIDLFFEDKFSADSALIYKVKGKIVSMIYFPSYLMKFYSSTFQAGYVCGAERRNGVPDFACPGRRSSPLSMARPTERRIYSPKRAAR